MRYSDKEKEMREAYEWYINQIAYNYADGEGYYDYGGIGMKQKARRAHPFEDYWPGKEEFSHWKD